MAKLLGLREYARHRGVTLRAVQKAISQGRIRLTRGADGVQGLDPVEADREWAANTDQAKRRGSEGDAPEAPSSGDGMPSAAPKGVDFARARAVRETYQAQLAKLTYEERTGKLIDADQVKSEQFELTRQVRDALMNLPHRISTELASETDPVKVHSILTQALTAALQELVDAGRRRSDR